MPAPGALVIETAEVGRHFLRGRGRRGHARRSSAFTNLPAAFFTSANAILFCTA